MWDFSLKQASVPVGLQGHLNALILKVKGLNPEALSPARKFQTPTEVHEKGKQPSKSHKHTPNKDIDRDQKYEQQKPNEGTRESLQSVSWDERRQSVLARRPGMVSSGPFKGTCKGALRNQQGFHNS